MRLDALAAKVCFVAHYLLPGAAVCDLVQDTFMLMLVRCLLPGVLCCSGDDLPAYL